MEANLLTRVARLEHLEAIRRLKHRYCYACDHGYDTRALGQLFATDAIWEASGFGRHVGREAILAFFEQVSNTILAAAHLVTNELIDIAEDGLHAHGVWRILQPMTLTGPDHAPVSHWLLARYDEDYVLVDGQWVFSHLRADLQFMAPHQSGWDLLWPAHQDKD